VATLLAGMPAVRTLDVGCGTGFVTRHLPGTVIGADRSLGMVRAARPRLAGPTLCADALRLPFRDASFGRVFAGHVYGHLTRDRARAFRAETLRLAPELVILEPALRPDVRAEEVQERVLNDGSAHRVYKRYFGVDELAAELRSAVPLHAGRWFVVVRSSRANGVRR
jgi:SAM-dependent methyltransferase